MFKVDSMSHRVASGKPLEVTQTISPQPVTDIQPSLDAENITLQWPRPDGRIGRSITVFFLLKNVKGGPVPTNSRLFDNKFCTGWVWS